MTGPRPGGLLHRLLIADTRDGRIQFLRYGFVGSLAFAVDFGSLWLLTGLLGVHYLVSAGLAFLLGLLSNYALSIAWVFKEHRSASRREEFLGFALIGLAGLGFTELGIWLLAGKLGVDYRLAKMVTTVLVFFWNFVARKYLLFRSGPAAASGTELP